MAFKIAEAFVELKAQGLAQVNTDIARLKGNFVSMISPVGLAVGAFTAFTAAVAALGTAIAAAAVSAVKQFAEWEQLEVQFEVLLHSAEAGQKALADLADFAASTPFELPEIAKAGQQLLAFGTTAQELTPTLTMLGDIAAGTGTPIGELAAIFGKAKVQGRLFAEDLNQLSGRGINVVKAMAERFGVAESAIKEMVTEGKIGFADLQLAMLDLAETDFAGLMERQSQTLAGLWSTLRDEVGAAMREIGETIANEIDLQALMTDLITLVDEMSAEFVPAIGSGIDVVQFLADAFRDLDSVLNGPISKIENLINVIQGMRIAALEALVAFAQLTGDEFLADEARAMLDEVSGVADERRVKAREAARKRRAEERKREREQFRKDARDAVEEREVDRIAEGVREAGEDREKRAASERERAAKDAQREQETAERDAAREAKRRQQEEVDEESKRLREETERELDEERERKAQRAREQLAPELEKKRNEVAEAERAFEQRSRGNQFTGLAEFWKQIQSNANKPSDIEKRQLEVQRQQLQKLEEVRRQLENPRGVFA